MLAGRLRPNGLPLLPITIGGQAFEAVLDTGLEGALQIPAPLIRGVGGTYAGTQKYNLGDGGEVELDMYVVDIEFDVAQGQVLATSSNHDEILIGTELLRHFRLTIDWPAGTVLLERPGP